MAIGNAKKPESRKGYVNEKNLIFSTNIRARRLELGLKQSELAMQLGWKQSQVSALEGGSFVESADRIVALADALQCTCDELLRLKK